MRNKKLQFFFAIISIMCCQAILAQKPIICTAERMNQRTSFDTSYFTAERPLADNFYLWDNAKTLYIKFLNGSSELQEKTKILARQWEKYANIHFQFVEDALSNIRIEFSSDGFIYSAIGTLANMYASNEATMLLDTTNPKILEQNTLHLFGHVLGLQDEIYSTQYDVRWSKKLAMFFSSVNAHTEKENFIKKYELNFSNGIKYDEHSIMVAGVSEAVAANKKGLSWNKTISEGDKKVIAIFYPKERVDYEKLKNKPTLKFSDLKIVKKSGFSFFPIFDFDNRATRNPVYFSIVLVNRNGEPIKTENGEYNVDSQIGTFAETMFMQGNFRGINKNKLSDIQFFIPQSVFTKIEARNDVFAVFKAFYFNQDERKVDWLYVSKPFEVKL
jgi:hypothetical protein